MHTYEHPYAEKLVIRPVTAVYGSSRSVAIRMSSVLLYVSKKLIN